MRYLGGLRGTGILKCGSDTASASAAYDIDGFLRGNNQVAACGEIRMSPGALRNVFGRRDLQLLTDDGRVLRLSFCGPRPRGRHDVSEPSSGGHSGNSCELRDPRRFRDN